ncbi:unnamed protein product [Musa acuminata subsp. malaccensis]|uniref:(wild Malaysian banana) hypothetical protein n=1 Tax=Musa acuminata subsp. malaccensis TaxID=214687 RepID=A0A804IIW5_MUSAM|nr:unnamed protein product [Musa acuminata subsp. malaccensis]
MLHTCRSLEELSLHGILTLVLRNLSNLRALVLYGNKFSGVISKEIGGLTMLELLDLRNNMLNGTIPKEIVEILSLKHLLLGHNKFQGSTPLIENPKMHFDLMHDQNLSCGMTNDLGRVNRKVKHWLNIICSVGFVMTFNISFFSKVNFLCIFYVTMEKIDNVLWLVLSKSCGTFAHLPAKDTDIHKYYIEHLVYSFVCNSLSYSCHKTHGMQFRIVPSGTGGTYRMITSNGCFTSYPRNMHVFGLPQQGCGYIGPWKTGLSGQLQKAFVTGVPKLKGSELEAACEDFSNIVISHPEFTVYNIIK